MMQFDVAGPFELQRFGLKNILTKESVRMLKSDVAQLEPGLSEACGCYVFALKAGGGIKPYYVGQACKRSLVAEAMNAANVTKYNEILGGRERGKPVLFLLPMKTRGGKFRRRKNGNGRLGALDFLERWLIAAALEKNPSLKNNRETKFLRNIHVTGIFNARQGEANSASRELRTALF